MTKKTLVNYLKKSFFTGAFKTVIVALATLGFLPLIIQQVGMETYGLISLTMIFGGVLMFADFGVAKSVTLLIGQVENKSRANDIISNALVINLLMLGLIGAVLGLIAFLEIPVFGGRIELSQMLTNYVLFIGFILLVIMLINNLLVAILEAYFLMHYANIGFTISSITINVFIYTTSLLTDSVYFLLMAPVLSFLLVSLYFVSIIKFRTDVKLVRPCLSEVKMIVSVGLQFLKIGLIYSFVIPANKYLLIYLTGSSSALGIFDVSMKIAMNANSFLNSIAQPLFGVFSNMDKQKELILRIASKVSLLLFALYCFGCVVYYFIGGYVVNIIDAKNHEELYWVSLILLSGVSFTSVSEPFYRALLGMGKLKVAFYLRLLIPVVNVILYCFLVFLSGLSDLARVSISYSCAMLVSSIAIIIYNLHSRIAVVKR